MTIVIFGIFGIIAFAVIVTAALAPDRGEERLAAMKMEHEAVMKALSIRKDEVAKGIADRDSVVRDLVRIHHDNLTSILKD